MHKHPRRSRSTVLLLTALAVFCIAAATWVHPSIALSYNASASAPVGWYRVIAVGSDVPLEVGDLVVARLPRDVAELAHRRGYVPRAVPVLKQIVAIAGTHVCVAGDVVKIGGHAVATAARADAHGRPLPAWRGCRALLPQELFLLNANHPESFDSRYFGPLDRSFVLGRAMPLAIR